MEGWVDLGSLIADRPGIKPTKAWSQVRRPKHYATEQVSLAARLTRLMVWEGGVQLPANDDWQPYKEHVCILYSSKSGVYNCACACHWTGLKQQTSDLRISFCIMTFRACDPLILLTFSWCSSGSSSSPGFFWNPPSAAAAATQQHRGFYQFRNLPH